MRTKEPIAAVHERNLWDLLYGLKTGSVPHEIILDWLEDHSYVYTRKKFLKYLSWSGRQYMYTELSIIQRTIQANQHNVFRRYVRMSFEKIHRLWVYFLEGRLKHQDQVIFDLFARVKEIRKVGLYDEVLWAFSFTTCPTCVCGDCYGRTYMPVSNVITENYSVYRFVPSNFLPDPFPDFLHQLLSVKTCSRCNGCGLNDEIRAVLCLK
jgi:hypothetical protein